MHELPENFFDGAIGHSPFTISAAHCIPILTSHFPSDLKILKFRSEHLNNDIGYDYRSLERQAFQDVIDYIRAETLVLQEVADAASGLTNTHPAKAVVHRTYVRYRRVAG